MRCLPPLLIALFCCATPLAAQDSADPISTDRPGLATGTFVVQPGRVQVEVGTPGVARTSRDIDGSFRDENGNPVQGEATNRTINFPTILRVGVLPWLEARASSSVYNFQRSEPSGRSAEGTGRLSVGTKARLLRGGSSNAVPTLSILPLVTLPLGEAPFTTSEGVGYAATLLADWSLPARLGATLNGGVDLTPVDGTDDFIATTTVIGSLGRPFAGQFSAYVEGAFRTVDGEANEGYAGAGLTYRVVSTLQLDAFFDRGLTDDATDWLFGGGISIRFGD